MSDIESRTRDVMMKVLQIAPQDISPDISRKNRPAWDSLKHMNLMLALEDEFGIEFSDKEIVELNSLHHLVDALQAKRS